jgi:hypothetical protein
MWTAMKKVFADKNNQEEATRNSGLEYVIVRPGGLSVEPPTGVINVIEGEAGSIPRADVAQFCLDAIRVADFPYIGKVRNWFNVACFLLLLRLSNSSALSLSSFCDKGALYFVGGRDVLDEGPFESSPWIYGVNRWLGG